jgi:short-subunit dehydrogenase
MSSAYSFGTIIDRVQSLSLKTIAGVVIGCSILFYWRSKLSSRHLRKSSTLGGTRNLGNEIVIVTGGSGGIGQHISEQLAREKARVLILDIKAPEFQLSTGIAFYKTDITSTKDVARVASEIRHLYGDPTALVNAAGVFNRGSLLENDEREIRETFEVNTLSHFFLVKEFLPSMIQMNRGHIITVASAASFVTVAEMMAYCCTKASALAFHEGLRQELKHWYNAPGIKTR